MDTQPHLNYQTGVYTRVRATDGLLHIVGALAHPDDPRQPSGLWCSALVDERPSDPRIVAVTVSELPPLADEDEPSREVIRRGELAPGERPARITANVLRTAPLEQIHEVITERRGGVARELAGTIPDPTAMVDHDDRYYAAWAAHYVATAASGSRRPVVDLAERFGVTRDSVRDTLNVARGRQLLTRGVHGRAGGQLTARAIDALEHEEG